MICVATECVATDLTNDCMCTCRSINTQGIRRTIAAIGSLGAGLVHAGSLGEGLVIYLAVWLGL